MMKAAAAPLDWHVNKLPVMHQVLRALYWHLGLENYTIWALDNSVSPYTLVSKGLCHELCLTVRTSGLLGSYYIAEEQTRHFAGYLDEIVI